MTRTSRQPWSGDSLTFTQTQITFISLASIGIPANDYARRESFVIVTKDSDFSDLCILLGFPPKVIWIRRGNCSTSTIESILRHHSEDINALDRDEIVGILTLF